MLLKDFLNAVAHNYDRAAGLATPTQDLLRRAGAELADYVPGGLLAKGSGGKGVATYTPWVGFFDPDETENPQEGVYVVFIFAQDFKSVTLTLNQGMEFLRRAVGDAGARQRLKMDAKRIRDQLPAELRLGLSEAIMLSSKGDRQQNYEAGNICARTYPTAELPPDSVLAADLRHFLELYQLAIEAKRRLLLTEPGSLGSPSLGAIDSAGDPLRDFKPKSDADYVTYLTGRQLRKSRRHETLVREYGLWAHTEGFRPATNVHPRDLVLRTDAAEWLVEAKVVYLGNATDAVRAALGQLLTYRYFLYGTETEASLLALFSEPVGDAYVIFLARYGIESVWREAGMWVGSAGAERARLAQLSG